MPDLFGRSYSRSALSRRIGRLEQVAGVRLATLGDGGGRGVRVLEFRTGTGLSFDVLVDRAFDIGRCEPPRRPARVDIGRRRRGAVVLRARGARLLPHLRRRPPRRRAASSTRSSWRRTLPSSTTTRRSRPRASACTAASRTARPASSGYGERWDGDECTLWAEGETQVGGRVRRAARCCAAVSRRVVGESRLRVHDVVENVGHDLTPHMLLYHVNAGFPVVDEGSELLVAATDVRRTRATTP